ncbi:outer membrane protein [Fulvimarina sp. 2208YS6-2-32]|uniref:Outer membrane protein n=1 Tax=Fulvimarina uroteuthidis TaxID=3098149 RepID=A0ABU5I748_9HYPH|nr:outer membrane protein [Fulvimarina sp. 2208YS6-2-32]MDY8110733.1 outer membrane protein [Fulvimarina sp. 2208YS6-2-32]
MNSRLLTTVAALGALTTISFSAHAADLIEPPIYVEPAPIIHPEPVSTSGWYLRGDVGYRFEESTNGRYRYLERGYGQYNPVTNHTVYRDFFESYNYDEITLEKSALISGGVGYRFNDFARIDLTADYFKNDLRGSTACANVPFDQCSYDDESESDVWVLMANAYADLGTYAGITPYVGGGLGFAHVSYSALKNKFDCKGDYLAASKSGHHGGNSLCGTTLTHEGMSNWRFAYGLTAGASFDITSNLKFDAGYKWTHVNGGEAFGFDALDIAAGASGAQGHDNGFDIHTVRAGLRYEFGGCCGGGFGKAPVPVGPVFAEPAPLYAEPEPLYSDVVYK